MIHVGFIPVVLLFFLHLLCLKGQGPCLGFEYKPLFQLRCFLVLPLHLFFVALEPTLQSNQIAVASWLCTLCPKVQGLHLPKTCLQRVDKHFCWVGRGWGRVHMHMMEAVGCECLTETPVTGHVCPILGQTENQCLVWSNFIYSSYHKNMCFNIFCPAIVFQKDVSASIYADNFRMLEL